MARVRTRRPDDRQERREAVVAGGHASRPRLSPAAPRRSRVDEVPDVDVRESGHARVSRSARDQLAHDRRAPGLFVLRLRPVLRLPREQPLELDEYDARACAAYRPLRAAHRALRHARRIRERQGHRRLLPHRAQWERAVPRRAASLPFGAADSIRAIDAAFQRARSEQGRRPLAHVSPESEHRFHLQEAEVVGYEVGGRVAQQHRHAAAPRPLHHQRQEAQEAVRARQENVPDERRKVLRLRSVHVHSAAAQSQRRGDGKDEDERLGKRSRRLPERSSNECRRHVFIHRRRDERLRQPRRDRPRAQGLMGHSRRAHVLPPPSIRPRSHAVRGRSHERRDDQHRRRRITKSRNADRGESRIRTRARMSARGNGSDEIRPRSDVPVVASEESLRARRVVHADRGRLESIDHDDRECLSRLQERAMKIIHDPVRSPHAPETAKYGLLGAFVAGADALRLPVRLTADGKLAVLEDDDVSRLTGAQGLVSKMTWREVRALNFGANFKAANGNAFTYASSADTFPMLLDYLPSELIIVADLKTSDTKLAHDVAQSAVNRGFDASLIVLGTKEQLDVVKSVSSKIGTDFTVVPLAQLESASASNIIVKAEDARLLV